MEVQQILPYIIMHNMLALTEALYAAMAEVDDLEGGGIVLDTGQVCHLPLIPLEGDSHRFP